MRLSNYSSANDRLPQQVLQEFLDSVAAGRSVVPIDKIYQFEQLKDAHDRMNAGLAAGKMVVLTGI